MKKQKLDRRNLYRTSKKMDNSPKDIQDMVMCGCNCGRYSTASSDYISLYLL